ncbi:hypothetical protein PLESTB_001282200 [Pleodorina starrii]|uniref:PHD-type domain-containing protein n=1 Tax=Pleodorina starrii TaxID=330485 RepID=A0A9W6BUQ9_9CHLO|nr:hypothetical protein PLESTM_001943200 [Pleodorina starrii]GLC57861.1 hypothetical protein PLESTB_001282200 [Pleodorina starrii]GLC69930.1 hypothetical protein PLESTF_000899900 [Pleodorina starrii]
MDANRYGQNPSRDWLVLFEAYKRQGHPEDQARRLANTAYNRVVLEHLSRVLPAVNAAQAAAHQNYNPEQQERHRREQEQRIRREQERQREAQQHHEAAQANDEGGEEDGEGQVEIYEQYRPVKVTEGPPHPDPIVETASLASVTPPDISYKHHLQDNLERSELSNAQLETVLYAFQRFERRLPDGARAGFFLGDGAGVGKGRQIAAVIKEFWATGGRRVLWVSTSNDLRYDARRDLSDLGVAEKDIPVYPPKKDGVPAGNLERIYPKGGVLFITYSLLVSKGTYKPPAAAKKGRNSGGSGAAAAGGGGGGRGRGRGRAYGGAAGEEVNDEAAGRALEFKRAEVRRLFGPGSRLHQIVTWLGGPTGDAECLVVLDECHKAKNLLDAAGNSSQTGLAVESLQDQLPNARVLYSSATGASEPNNLRYMIRLGAFDYPHIGDMINALKKSGLGALEMFCMGLKATGTYVSRTLSYKGAEFKNEELKIDPIFSVMYDRSCSLWSLVYNVLRALPKAKNARGRDMKASLFWGAHQRFYRQMLIASKVRRCAELAQDALERGMCVVIGLQSTGESNLNSAREAAAGGSGGGDEDGGMDDFVSAPRMILHGFISQWLFHFTEPVQQLMTKKKMQHLQSEIYRACLEWKKQGTAADEADRMIRMTKLEAAQAAREAARAAGAAQAGGSAAGGSAAQADRPAAARAAAAAAAAGPSAAPAIGSPGAPSAYASAAAKQPAPRYDEVDEDDDSIGVEIPDSDDEVGEVTGGGAAGQARGGGGAAAAAAATATACASDSDGELEVVKERSLDEALAERRRRALLAGDMIDLADGDDDASNPAVDAERQRLLAQADAEEAAELEATERRKRDERRAKLEASLAEAREDAEKVRSEVERLEQLEKEAAGGAGTTAAAAAAGGGAYGSAAPAAPTARRGGRPGRGADSGGGSSGAVEEGLEDDMDCDKENEDAAAATAAAAGAKPAGGERRSAVLTSDSDVEDDEPLAAAARRGSGTGGRRRGAAVLDDADADGGAADGAAANGGDEQQQPQQQQQRPGNSSGRRAPSGSSAAEEQQQTSQGGSKKRARSGTPAGGSGGGVGAAAAGNQEEVVSSPMRSSRSAAHKAAAKISATAGGSKPAPAPAPAPAPPKPPKGPSAPKSAAVTVKTEAGTSGSGAGAAAAKAAKPAASEDSDVIVITDSDEEEGAKPKKQQQEQQQQQQGKKSQPAPAPAAEKGGKGKSSKKDEPEPEPEEEEKEEKEEPEEEVEEEDDEEEEDEEESDYETYEDTMCAKCGGGERPHTILLCDGCDDGYHMACLEPPLKAIPKGDWHCPKCVAAKAAKAKGSGKAAAAGAAAAPAGSAGQKRKASEGAGPSAAAGGDGDASNKAAKSTKTPQQPKSKPGPGDEEEDSGAKGAEEEVGEDEELQEAGGRAAAKRQKTANGAAKAVAAAKDGKAAAAPAKDGKAAAASAKGGKAAAAKDGKAAAGKEGGGGKAAKAAAAGKGRQRAAVDDDKEGEGSDAVSEASSSSEEEQSSEESVESVDDSDDDDFVAEGHNGAKRGGRLQRGAPQRGARGQPARGSAAARFGGGDDDDDDDDGGGGADRNESVNVFKVRMQLRAARQRLREAEQRVSTAQRDLTDHERATATNRRANGGNANGRIASDNRRGSDGTSSSGDGSSSSSDDSDDDDDDEDEEFSGGAVAAGGRRGPRAPVVYRHAAKNKPLGKIPSSWKGGGRGGGSAGRGGQRRSGEEESDESSDDSSDDVSLEAEEAEGSSDSEGGEVELVEEAGPAGGGRRGQEAGGCALPPELRKCRAMLLRLLEAQELPLNPLDQLTELLGGEGKVAEMTGRKVLQVRNDEGKIVCKQRRDDEAQKMVNIAEKNDFMSGRKLVAIISDAASTGISLQADRRVPNQRRRFHITLELPWSADKAIQQFGRSHRSNQATAPEYCLLVTKCGGEYRFAGAVAKRLTSLGALLRGDRRALGASSDLKPYDVDNKYGEQAVVRVLECVSSGFHNVAGAKVGDLPPDMLPPQVAATPAGSIERSSAFLQHMQRCLKTMGLLAELGNGTFVVEKKDSNTSVVKFLNRLLGLHLRDQDLLFQYFFGIMESLIKQARSAGDYEEGVLNLSNSSVAVALEQTVHVDQPTGAATSYMELDVDDGLSYEDASRVLEAALADMRAENAPQEAMNRVGFYVGRRNANVGGTGHPLVVLATALRTTVLGSRAALKFRIQRPNQVKGHVFTQYELEEKYRKVDVKEGEKQWKFWYHYLDRGCLHGNDCVRRKREGKCNFGSRFYRLYLVTGALLPVLRKLFDTVLRSGSNKKAVPRVARVLLKNKPEQEGGGGAGEAAGSGQAAGGSGAGPSNAAGGGASGSGTAAEGRVVVGLSLSERDAEAFVMAVSM